jgi:hypothetical protein
MKEGEKCKMMGTANDEQTRQCTEDVTLRGFRETIIAVEKQ